MTVGFKSKVSASMKNLFTPLIASLFLLTSMSECNPFEQVISAPISAEVNGVEYYSEGYTFGHYHYACAEYTQIPRGGFKFSLARNLYSENNDSFWVNLDFTCDNDSLQIDTCYSLENSTGYIRFWEKAKDRVSGTFEFEIKDPETQEVITSVKNGKFIVPCYTRVPSRDY